MILVVVALGGLFIQLARWQYDRGVERGTTNDQIEQNLDREPKPVEQVMGAGSPDPNTEWTPVTATGRYDVQRELLVRYRYLDSVPGFEVLTPLTTTDGRALLVDRGWVPAPEGATDLPDVPPPPAGKVTVSGWVRASESGPADQVRPGTGQVRFIDVGRIADSMPYPLYGGYVALTEQRPQPAKAPEPLAGPELDPGPHLSYAVQWCLFTLIALGGLGYLAYDEAHGRRGSRGSRSRRPSPEDVDDDEGDTEPSTGRVGQLDRAH